MNCLCAIYVDRNQRAFLAQMRSFVVRYDVIYHISPINSQYLMTWEVASPGNVFLGLTCNSQSLPPSLSCVQTSPISFVARVQQRKEGASARRQLLPLTKIPSQIPLLFWTVKIYSQFCFCGKLRYDLETLNSFRVCKTHSPIQRILL